MEPGLPPASPTALLSTLRGPHSSRSSWEQKRDLSSLGNWGNQTMSSRFSRQAMLAATAAILMSSLTAAWGASVIGGTYHDTGDASCLNATQCDTKQSFGLAPSADGVVIETVSCRILSYGFLPPVNLQLYQTAASTTIIYLPVATVGQSATYTEFHANLTGLRWGVPAGSRPKVGIAFKDTQKIFFTCSINGTKN